jgi:hypothetical protein
VLPSSRIESVTVVRAAAEVRIHRLVGVPPRTPVRLAGWAVAAEAPEALSSRVVEEHPSVVVAATPENVTGEPLSSQLRSVTGWTRAHAARASYGTAYGRVALVPELFGRSGEGVFEQTVLVALASLEASASVTDLASVSVTIDHAVVTIGWPQGEPSVIDLDAIDWPRR